MKKRNWMLIIPVILLLTAAAVFWAWKNSDSRFNVQECYQVDLTDSSVQMLPAVFQTNSTKLTVTSSRDQSPVLVCLYYEGETDSIMEYQLNGGETKSFQNLKSTFRYTVGVKELEGNPQSVSLNVEYRPVP